MLRRRAPADAAPEPWIFDPRKLYTLAELGLGYNTEQDALTRLDKPTEKYNYKMKQGDEMYNDQLWLALCRILQSMAIERLEKLGLQQLRLPLGASETDKHTIVFVTPDYEKQSELTLVFPDGGEIGNWYGRLITEDAISDGSFEKFVKIFSKDTRGLVIASPTACVWSKELARPVTHRQFVISSTKKAPLGKIPGSESQQAHVNYVLDQLALPSAAKEINLVAVGYSTWAAMTHLHSQWSTWQTRVTAVACLTTSHSVDEFTDSGFLDFLSANCVNFTASGEPLKTMVEDARFGCINVSGGSDVSWQLPRYCLEACLEFIEAIQQGGVVEYTQNLVEEALVEDELATDGVQQNEWENLVEEDEADKVEHMEVQVQQQ